MKTSTASRAPTHRLYVVRGDDQTARWTEIGAAWPHRDGKGFALELDAVPLTGRFVLREIGDSEDRSLLLPPRSAGRGMIRARRI